MRLGSVLLAAVLLGVPRALEARSFGAPRSVYMDVARPAPDLAGFAEELQRALEAAGCRLAARPDGATFTAPPTADSMRGTSVDFPQPAGPWIRRSCPSPAAMTALPVAQGTATSAGND